MYWPLICTHPRLLKFPASLRGLIFGTSTLGSLIRCVSYSVVQISFGRSIVFQLQIVDLLVTRFILNLRSVYHTRIIPEDDDVTQGHLQSSWASRLGFNIRIRSTDFIGHIAAPLDHGEGDEVDS